MSMSIDNLTYDESKDLEHWKSWSDDKWIAKMRDRLPSTYQTRDHIADCNQLIDKLVLEVVYSKDSTITYNRSERDRQLSRPPSS